ncbi:type II 3-dehydroquinate dehydratase [Candidatus Xianfuyuplasma coldseepsis]|uniref:3-dehydroquinate dehydratase n=1 Tax=Candidatus Xianfuyuplasma coldseepsis TaxID=2782163 RepID=A0A7L7KRW2_9MOLU|nr:type II 3-dehydroquinate dehydratase [Xianfuyuplasma coldseepsis]QMS84936.1 type II 3-dehydroquinate dehydratase [Xianfuyuplasma coldseepsis]
MNILILNGPNLNMLGIREPEVYGSKTYQDLESYLHSFEDNYPVTIDVKQSNLEGLLIDILHYANDHYDGVLFNAGAFTHYSYALYDAIKSITIPVVEVHLSDITTREEFRKVSVIRNACVGSIMGLGFKSYEEGLKLLLKGRDEQ